MEKAPERNILKEAIEKYNITVSRIPAIKKGQDFITGDGDVITNEALLSRGRNPCLMLIAAIQNISGDGIIVRGVDLLYHEATFDAGLTDLAKLTGHSTSTDAARSALEAKQEH
jgi:ribonuclease Z